MRDFPTHVRSVVIDSVVPLDGDFEDNLVVNMNRAFTTLWKACKAQSLCNSAFPNLDTVFYDMVAQLYKKPVTVQLTDSGTLGPYAGKPLKLVLDGGSLIAFLFNAMYSTNALPEIPRVIYSAKNGDFTDIATLLDSNMAWDYTFNVGMQYSVICHESAPFSTVAGFDKLSKGQPAALVTFWRFSMVEEMDLCQQWGAGEPDKTDNQAISSKIPTVVIAGAFDPITPPDGSKHVANGLSNSTFILIADGGHGPSLVDQCPMTIMTAFFDDPVKKPNTTCVKGIGAPFFLPF